MIIQGDESIDNINTSYVMAQSENITTDEEITSSEILQTSPLTPEIEVFTFEDVDEFSKSGVIITRVEDHFHEKDDELSRNPL